MSNRSKNNKNQVKVPNLNDPQTQKSYQNSALTLNPIPTTSPLKNQPISPKGLPSISSPSNLMIVKQASLSSQDGFSKKGFVITTKRPKKQPSRSKIEHPQLQAVPILQAPAKQQEVVYDDYNILKISGVLDAYEHFLKLLCKHGLPNGKIYEYAAQQILKYEKHKINKELKMRAELDIQKIGKKTDRSSPSPEKSRMVSPYQF